MRICRTCVLPENFPGLRLDAHGVCQYCREHLPERLAAKRVEARRRFEELLRAPRGRADYDALVCLSGGKDSTFTLMTLVRVYRLKVLAFTLDNGFASPQAARNIRAVTARLGVDHLELRPRRDLLRTVFAACAERNIYPPKTLERASAVCTACMSLVKASALKIAVEKEIPFLVYGWSPGQAPVSAAVLKNNPAMLAAMQKAAAAPLAALVGEAIAPYFLSADRLRPGAPLPTNIHPLAFWEVGEAEIVRRIRELGWEPPQDTDPNSTNCLLNAFANQVHRRQFGFHPYAFELAGMVRLGMLDRDQALARLDRAEDPALVERIRAELRGGG